MNLGGWQAIPRDPPPGLDIGQGGVQKASVAVCESP
jgi:hypothetical protein